MDGRGGEGTDRVTTGVDGLDAVLGGGLFPGAACIVSGPPGAGKTILGNQFCFGHAAAGRGAVYLSLLSESHDRMLAHLAPMRFVDRALVPSSLTYVSASSSLAAGGLAGLLGLVRAQTAGGVRAAVLDGLFAAREQAPSEHAFREFVHALQGHAAFSGVTMLLLDHGGAGEPGVLSRTMADGWIDLLDEVRGARAMRALVVRKHRGGPYLRGRHQYRITDDGIVVFPRVEALLSREPAASETEERVGTGIDGLDRMIGGGYPAGSATMLLGPTGAGKTTLGLQFLAACTPEAPGVLFGLYETPARLRTKARSIGVDLGDLVARGAVEVVWQSPAENLPDELGHRLLGAVARTRAKRVLMDGIGALRHAFLFPERLPVFLNALNDALRAAGTTAVYTLEIPDLHMPTDLGTDDLSSMVDNLLLLHYAAGEGRLRRRMVVLKVRDSDFDSFPEEFHVTSAGVRFGPDAGRQPRPDADAGSAPEDQPGRPPRSSRGPA